MCTTNRLGLWRQAWTAALAAGLIVAVAHAAEPEDPKQAVAEPVEAPPPPAPPADRGAAFDVERLVVWVGRTQVIPFRVTEKVDADRRFTFEIEHPQQAEVILEPAVLAGREIGFLRVRGLREGATRLTVADASIAVQVKALPAAGLTAERSAPIITSPAMGSVVWGQIAVGVELFDDPVQLPGEPGTVSLVLADGTALPVLEDASPESGPSRRLAFALDTSTLKPGPVTLTAVAQRAGRSPVLSQAVSLYVVRPGEGTLVSGEAESLVDVPRPDRYNGNNEQKQRPLQLRKANDASGGQYVANSSSRPPFAVPVKAETAGWYQLILQVGSDFAGGAYPSIGIRVDNESEPATAARLARETWHRMPIGRPIRLEPGEHTLIAWFENDFNAHGTDRNLRIDTYELLRLDPWPVDQNIAIEGPNDPRLSVVMRPVLDGKTLGGAVTVTGSTDWRRPLSPNPPTISLLLNGEPIMTQRTLSPSFHVDRGHFKPGRNTLELEAKLDTGQRTRSGAQTVTLAPYDGEAPARRMLYFSAVDDAWSPTIGERIRWDDRDRRRVAALYSNGQETLTLPEDLAGHFGVRLEARGDSFKGPPIAKVTLVQGGQETVIGEIEVSGGYRSRGVGNAQLSKGPKQLHVAFTNDAYDADAKKDRNLYIEAVVLQESAKKDTAAPSAHIVYPESGQEVYRVDAVVVDTADDQGIKWAELLLDGQAMGFQASPVDGEARLVVPLVLRELSPGEHDVAVRVADEAGNTRDSEPVRILVLGDAPSQPTRYERAVRLLNRFGYGPEPAELAAVLTMGPTPYLRDRLWCGWDDAAEQTAWRWAEHVHSNDRSGGSVAFRVVEYALTSENPVRTRFVMWTDNHFSTWLRKARAERKAEEFVSFARLGSAPFGELLLASATSPAMLVYLDQHRSFVKRINENYAREIMELHSLGVGAGYSQHDVTELAHLITGWTCSSEAPLDGSAEYAVDHFRYIPKLNDPQAREVFGLRLPDVKDQPRLQYDRVHLVIEMLASHPSTARHISRQLAEHYVSVPAPQPLVDDLAKVFMQTGGDLREVLLALSEHPVFLDENLAPRLTRPLDYALRLGRATHYDNPRPIIGYLNRSAVGLFDRDTPDGYPEEDQAYTDSNVTLQRWRLARDLERAVFDLVPASLRNPAEGADEEVWRQRVVDAAAVGLTGRLLTEPSNAAAMDVLRQTKQKGNERILLITGLIAQMPEALLR